MSGFGFEGFASVQSVKVEIYTSAYRINGTMHTPFRRVAEILNQLPSAHVSIEDASITEHAAPSATTRAPSALVAVDEILVMAAPDLGGEPRAEMRIQKTPAWASLAMPTLRVTGTVHVPVGSLPSDGLLNVGERFMPMTDVAISSGAHPELDRRIAIVAVRRDRAQVMVVAEAPPGGSDESGMTRSDEGAS